MRYARAFVCLLLLVPPVVLSSPVSTSDTQARVVLEAFRRSWPDKIQQVSWQDGDWTILVGNKTYFWARGRIMPAEQRQEWGKYKPYVFYAYPIKVKDPSSYTEEQVEQLRREGEAEARISGPDHHPAFRAALYGGGTRGAVETKIVKTTLFGKQVSVHRDIVDAVKNVDETIAKAAKNDPEVKAFLANLGSLGGYNWREIRGTSRLSYHSWGMAIDIQPRKIGNKITYWGWERARNDDWMLVPLDKRWSPPKAVIRAFENEGFIWGGKWEFYDNMHFEYRPELHELSKVIGFVLSAESARGLD